MKTTLLLLSASLLLACPAMAERKLWTYTLPVVASDLFRGFLASSVDATGNTALVIGEYRIDPNTYEEIKQVRLLWISSKGVVLHSETVATPDEGMSALLGNDQLAEPWSVLAITPNSWSVTNGHRRWIGGLKGKAVTVAVKDLPDGSDISPAGTGPAFSGWFERQTEGPYRYNKYLINGAGIAAYRSKISGFSLWSAK